MLPKNLGSKKVLVQKISGLQKNLPKKFGLKKTNVQTFLRLPGTGTVRGCYLFIRMPQEQVTETRKKGIETRD